MSSLPPLKLTNVLKQRDRIHRLLYDAALGNETTISLPCLLRTNTAQIESICDRHQVTPAALAAPSRLAYAWMKFLTDEQHLQLHLATLRRSIEIGTDLINTHRRGIGEIFIDLSYGASLYKSRTIGNCTTLSISEGFIRSSDDLLGAVLHSAIVGKTEASNQAIRQFGMSEEYSDLIWELDLLAQIASETAQGNYYNLDELFATIDREYFEGKTLKPRLIWSGILSSRKLGHYERTRDRVVLSQTLDDRRIPQCVVEFVLYHELLHKHHGIKWVNGRCLAHTPEFRHSERKFRQYQQAQSFLTGSIDNRH
jgi:SprT-like family